MKKGSIARASTSGGMPRPLSRTARRRQGAFGQAAPGVGRTLFARGDHDLAAVERGVAGVEDQVQQRGFQLAGVTWAVDRPSATSSAGVPGSPSVRCSTAPRRAAGPARRPLAAAGAPAREASSLAREFGAAAHARRRWPRAAPSLSTGLQQLPAARHHRQQVVEIVGHAAGELADGVQAVDVRQLLFGMLLR
ncbi:hypothetical protein [Luteimonas granuli]|uniref:Uncharacterized protein n=1 Tax=Luteimonas granuli TaxID=1176533 RepID=A0A518N0Q9_9GAMM|nr:hypothetical protein [Luteimonas granuli]QDW65499.1 hypothetical protein FPZ22_00020 [Luteimonas granuli]